MSYVIRTFGRYLGQGKVEGEFSGLALHNSPQHGAIFDTKEAAETFIADVKRNPMVDCGSWEFSAIPLSKAKPYITIEGATISKEGRVTFHDLDMSPTKN